MHVPKKSKVEKVEEAMKEAAEYAEEEAQRGIQITISLPAPPAPAKKAAHHHSSHKKAMPKKRKRKGLSGQHENALSGMY